MNEQAIILLFRLLIGVFLLRVWMQLARVDYYNPVTNRFVSTLSPLVDGLGTIVRPIGNVNLAALLLALCLGAGGMAVLFPSGDPLSWLIGGAALLISVALAMVFWILLAMVIASWVISAQNPWHQLMRQLMRPIMAPIQRVIPNLGGLDFSPIVVFLGVQLIRGVVETRLFLLSGLGGL